MNTKFYKMRRNRMISGVLAGLSDKWNLDVTLVRFLFAIFTIANFGLGIIIIHYPSFDSTKQKKISKLKCMEQAHARLKKPNLSMMTKVGFGNHITIHLKY